jgi:hypothetical protein
MHAVQPDLLDAPPYVVTCLDVDEAAGDGHQHVVAIETRDPDGGQTRWSTVQVIAALREGEQFVFRENERAGTSMEPAVCAGCGTATLEVPPDGFELAPCDMPPIG